MLGRSVGAKRTAKRVMKSGGARPVSFQPRSQGAGGRAGPVCEEVAPEHLPRSEAVPLRRERLRRVLGVGIDDPTVVDILERLGMRVESSAEGWEVTPPSCRFDIGIEVDLIEEIGRIYGYSRIPASHAMANTALRAEPETRFDLGRAKDQLLAERD